MRKKLFLLVFTILFSINIFAQDPAFVNDKAVEVKNIPDIFNSQTKIFTSAEGGFSVYFPRKPKKELKNIENPNGLTDFILYTTTSQFAFYGVTYFDTPTVIDNEAEKNLNYEMQKQALLDGLNGKLIEEQEFTNKEQKGKEYVIVGQGNTVTLRTFFAKQRLFRVLIVTPGVKGKIRTAKQRVNNTLAKKFFESFTVKEIPGASQEQTVLPDDFGVRIENSKFFSDFFGFEMKIPEGWNIFDKDETALAKEIGLEIANSSEAKNKEFTKNSFNKTEILIILSKQIDLENESPAVIVIGAEQTSYPNFKPEAIVGNLSKEFLDETEKVKIGVQKAKFDNVDFAWYEIIDKTDNSRQRMYIANVRGLAFEISFNFYSEKELNEMLSILNSIKFRGETKEN